MTSSGDWVPDVTLEAMRRILTHAAKVGLSNTDEFTFRAFFMAAAHDYFGSTRPRFQTEWHRFDLLVQFDEIATVLEFKYYIRRRTFDLRGNPLDFKGGPGMQNEREFNDCARKLRNAALPGVEDRRLILIYERDWIGKFRRSFHQSFGELAVGADIADVQALAEGPLESRILRPGGIRSSFAGETDAGDDLAR